MLGRYFQRLPAISPRMKGRMPRESDQVTGTSESGPWGFSPPQSIVGLTEGREEAQDSYSPVTV